MLDYNNTNTLSSLDIDKNKPFIFTINDKERDQIKYYIKLPNESQARIISSSKYFIYYDANYQVAPSLTIND